MTTLSGTRFVRGDSVQIQYGRDDFALQYNGVIDAIRPDYVILYNPTTGSYTCLDKSRIAHIRSPHYTTNADRP